MEQEALIKKRVSKLKEEKNLRKVHAMVVFGDVDNGEKEYYMSKPTFPQFSKFMAASKKKEVTAIRTLAWDCFIEGHKALM